MNQLFAGAVILLSGCIALIITIYVPNPEYLVWASASLFGIVAGNLFYGNK